MIPVVLVGLMGSGKSTVGRLVAQQTARKLVDVDTEISLRTGKSVRQLWEEGGESAYRHLESQVVLGALCSEQAIVLAAPGGVVLDPVVRSAMGDAFVVWLRCAPDTLVDRVQSGDHRPLLAESPYAVLTRMAAERAQLYEEVADLVVDTDAVEAATVATMVTDRIGYLPMGAQLQTKESRC